MVMGLLAKLLVTRQVKMEGGEILLKDRPMNLLPAFFVSELMQYFIEKDKLDELYFLSWYWGYVLVWQVKKMFNLKKPEDVYSLGMDLGQAMGIGLYKTHDYYPGRYTHFKIPNNPYLKYIKGRKYKSPIDFFISGSMGGGGCLVHSAVCQNIEIKCRAIGNSVCEFVTGTEKELKDRGLWKETVKRYNLKKYYPLQKEIFNIYNDKTEAQLLAKVMKKIST
ncbi:MAG: hypothetical protein ABIF08_03400 [Nanoarchaeota archaeon]